MKKILSILLFVFCLNIWQVSAQDIVSSTTKINARDLMNLLPSDENRKPVLLNFWATWCGPCHAEFPELVKIDSDYRRKGLVFNLISVDKAGLLETSVQEFLDKYRSTMYSYLLDLPSRKETAKVIRQIAPTFRDIYPLTLLFDKTGKLVYQKAGRINEKLLRAEIEKVLKK